MPPQHGSTMLCARWQRVTEQAPPPGFEPHFRRSPVTNPWEPLWFKRDDDGLRLGVWVTTAHCNARGNLHGGVIATLADNTMGLACADAAGSGIGMVTVSLTTDYLGAGQQGQWLEIVGTPSRVGRTLCFATAIITADGAVIARASGIFRTTSKGTG
jgi:uncharacterized protein (TIGR00369 family)